MTIGDKKQVASQAYALEHFTDADHLDIIEDAWLAGFEACYKYLTEFEKGERVQVTDEDHKRSNFWFEREFIQQDSDGKYACKAIDGRMCRWTYIRKIIK